MSIGRNSTSAAEIAKAFDGSELKRQASDRCDEIAVKLLGNPTQADRREMRWGSHGSRVLDLGRKRGLWYDHENGTGGDMIALVRDVLGCDFSAAVDWLHSELSLPRPERRKWSVTPAATLDEAERIDRARACYFAAKPALDRGKRYFESRGLDWLSAVEQQLRFDHVWLKGFPEPQPSLLMPLRRAGDGKIVGVHKIALEAFSGAKRAKQSAGAVKGAAMMLHGKKGGLCLSEGLETAVGAIMGGVHEGFPVWALAGSSFLSVFGPVPGVDHLIILADNDEAGLAAANDCARLWANDAVVSTLWPSCPGTDFADEFRRR